MKEEIGFVLRGLVVAAVLLFAIGSANAQTSPPTEGGPAAPKNIEGGPTEAPANGQTPQKTDVKVDPASEGFKVGLFTFKPGGRIKLDIIKDYDAITSEDSFDPRTIAVPEDGGNSSSMRVRHGCSSTSAARSGPRAGTADVRRGRFLREWQCVPPAPRVRQLWWAAGGQTWTNFLDPDNFPNTIDFESPMAFPSFRQAQVRYTAKLTTDVMGGVGRGQQFADREPLGARQGRVPIQI